MLISFSFFIYLYLFYPLFGFSTYAYSLHLLTRPMHPYSLTHCAQGELEPVYRAALALGTANQLTNILRDVGEDINERDRIYVPMDEIKAFNIEEREVLQGLFARSTGQIDDRWVQFMQFQIRRARKYFDESELGVNFLDANARYPVW